MTTIRHRLTGHLLLGWTLLLGAGLFTAYFLARTALTRQFDDAIQAKAMALSALFEQTEGNIELELPVQFMREFDAQGSMTLFQIWRTDGTVLRRSKSLRGDSLPLRYGTLPKPDCWDLPLPNGGMARAVGFKYQPQPADENLKKNNPFEAILVMAVNRRELDNTLEILTLVLGGCGLLMLALSAATMPLLLRRELAPLNFLAEETKHIDAQSLSTRFSNEGLPGELIPITTRLNDLLERLQTAFERERQFSADLAHEMRTPLAEIRSLAELAVRWPDTRDADFDRHILAVTIQMECILTRLLAIARSEHGPVPVSFEPFCLSDLIVTICQSLETRASARGIAFKANESAAFVIQSDPVIWRMILSNLLENSIEYSPSGATVRAHCEAKADQFTLTVTNPVEHLQIADLPHLGERFWRKDSARSNRGHSGLGLSLVRALTSAMGCRLEASMNDLGELSMAVSGPIGQSHETTPPKRYSVITETKNTNVKP
jgi:two-component system sensor histidine kinase QseC